MLGCRLTYLREIDPRYKLTRFNRMIDTILRMHKNKVRKDTIIKVYETTMSVPCCIYDSELIINIKQTNIK